MDKYLSKLLACTLVAFSTTAHTVTITWEDALRMVENENQTLEAAKKDWMAVQENESVATAGYFPKLNATTSATRSGSNAPSGGSFVSNGVVLNSGSAGNISQNYNAGLNFNQNIFSGLRDKSKIDQAEWRTKNSFWSYVSAKAGVSYSLKEAFANLAYNQELVSLSQSILDRRESNYRLVQVRFQNGRENKGSVLLSEAYKEQAELDLLKAKDSLDVAQVRIKALMNKDHLDTVEVTGEVPVMSFAEIKSSVEQQALETPAYNKAHSLEMAAAEDISIAKSSFSPTLDLTANALRQGSSYFPENERWNMALTLTIPLFDGMKDVASTKQAVYAKYSLEAQKRNALLDLLPKIRDAQNQAKQGDIRFQIDQKFQQAAGTRAEIARAKYNNGLLSFEDWDIIESELITRQTSFLASKRDRIIKYAAWENQLGKGSIQ